MSSANKTPNLNLHSWVPTDPVVRSDFNENFNKIDAAIGQMRASYGSCEIYTGEYTGTGVTSVSLTFPKLPLYIIIGQKEWPYLNSGFVGDGQRIIDNSGGYEHSYAMLSISGKTVTFAKSGSLGYNINDSDKHYQYIAFTSATL